MAIKALTKENFTSEVLEAKRPTLVEFFAPWCRHCRKLTPVLDRLAAGLGDELFIGTVNVDDEPELEEQFKVDTIPTLYLFQNGRHGEKLVAPQSQAQIEDWIRVQTGV